MGPAEEAFEKAVIVILSKHVPDLSDQAVQRQYSKHQKYLSITANFEATDQQQLDALYQELTQHPLVVMVL